MTEERARLSRFGLLLLALLALGWGLNWPIMKIVLRDVPPLTFRGGCLLAMHEPIDAMLAAGLADLMQVIGDLAVAIDATALQPELLDQPSQALIFLLACGHRLRPPSIVAGINGHHASQVPD